MKIVVLGDSYPGSLQELLVDSPYTGEIIDMTGGLDTPEGRQAALERLRRMADQPIGESVVLLGPQQRADLLLALLNERMFEPLTDPGPWDNQPIDMSKAADLSDLFSRADRQREREIAAWTGRRTGHLARGDAAYVKRVDKRRKRNRAARKSRKKNRGKR